MSDSKYFPVVDRRVSLSFLQDASASAFVEAVSRKIVPLWFAAVVPTCVSSAIQFSRCSRELTVEVVLEQELEIGAYATRRRRRSCLIYDCQQNRRKGGKEQHLTVREKRWARCERARSSFLSLIASSARSGSPRLNYGIKVACT